MSKKQTADTQGVRKLDKMSLETDEITVEEYEKSFANGTFELAQEELIFPLTVEDSGVEHVLFAHMTPYTHKEGIELFDAMGIKFKFEGREKLTTRTGLNEKTRPFFWSHFKSLVGVKKPVFADTEKELTASEVEAYLDGDLDAEVVEVALSREEQEQYIRDNPAKRIEEAAVMQGFGNFNIDVMTARKTSGLLIGGRNINKIVGHVFVYDPESGNQKIKVKIGFKKDSEFNFRRFLTATGQSELHRKSEEWQRIEDYKTILDIGKSEILFAEGYTINGKPCTEENKNEWVDLFPFWHLQACVNDIYSRGATVKNG